MTQPTKTLLNLLQVHDVKLEQSHVLPYHFCAQKKATEENYSYTISGLNI